MRAIHALSLFLIVPCALALAEAPSIASPFRVIVNSHNLETTLERAFIADAFLKKTTRWRNGEVILPVDLNAGSATRHKFSGDVLDRSVTAVRSYWQQLIFSGRDVPPAELDSDQDVVKYVAKHGGAIGYVSGTADVTGVKTVTLK